MAKRASSLVCLAWLVIAGGCGGRDKYAGPSPDTRGIHFEQRNMPAFFRGPHN